MQINSISPNCNSRTSFGVQYSDALVTGMSELAARFQKAHYKIYYKRKYDINTYLDFLPKKFVREYLYFFNRVNNVKKVFNKVNDAFPFKKMYIGFNKENKPFFALKTFFGEKLLAPIRVRNNLNPIEHPEAIHLRFKDLETVAKKMKFLVFEDFFTNIENLKFKKTKLSASKTTI